MSHEPLTVEATSQDVAAWKGDCLVVGVYQGGKAQKSLHLAGAPVEQAVTRALKDKWLTGKTGEILILPAPYHGEGHFRRVLLLGLGKRREITPESLRAAGGHVVAAAHKNRIERLLLLPSLDRHNMGRLAGAEALAEGALLGAYRFEHYRKKKSPDKTSHPRQLDLAIRLEQRSKLVKRLQRTTTVVRGVTLARDLANHPGNVVDPDYLARLARELGERLPIKTTILDEQDLRQAGMNGILAVGQGSTKPPRLIIMEYRNGGETPPLAVVGKAITFDSGGLSLKPPAKMEEMKYDMSGGAAVFGFLQAIAELKLPINVVGLVPTAENMPSGTAQRPGDVIRTAKGLFVEVINTDAEGRLILADALHHAEIFEPKAVIDLATLTGACTIALGHHCCGLLSNHDGLAKKVAWAGRKAGERTWRLPMFPEYRKVLESTIADLKNVGDQGAGTITAACFLSRFVGPDRPWVHLDIAGTAWEHTGRPHIAKGSAGFGVRLLCRLARTFKD
ncbi:MAG: leucyl aminopeptidase [Magnetococcales bacterium]|nr:leucyl aminopeptidase [Magnetococcales bacterium]